MAITIAYQGASAYTGLSSGSKALTVVPTSGQCLIILSGDYGSNLPVFSNFSLSVDGSPDAVSDLTVAGKPAVCLFWNATTTASQNISFTNSGQYSEGTFFVYAVTGAHATAPFGTPVYDSAAQTLNFDSTGDGVIINMYGSFVAASATYSEGTWTHDGGKRVWSLNLTAGTKAINISNTTPSVAAIWPLVAAGAAASNVPVHLIRPRSFGFNPGFGR